MARSAFEPVSRAWASFERTGAGNVADLAMGMNRLSEIARKLSCGQGNLKNLHPRQRVTHKALK
jgi:hypothetical protein